MQSLRQCTKFKTKNSLAALIAATTGIGKITASELLAAAGIDSNTTALTAEEEQRLANAIYSLQQSANQQTSAPVYAVISRTNQVKTILPFAPTIWNQAVILNNCQISTAH